MKASIKSKDDYANYPWSENAIGCLSKYLQQEKLEFRKVCHNQSSPEGNVFTICLEEKKYIGTGRSKAEAGRHAVFNMVEDKFGISRSDLDQKDKNYQKVELVLSHDVEPIESLKDKCDDLKNFDMKTDTRISEEKEKQYLQRLQSDVAHHYLDQEDLERHRKHIHDHIDDGVSKNFAHGVIQAMIDDLPTHLKKKNSELAWKLAYWYQIGGACVSRYPELMPMVKTGLEVVKQSGNFDENSFYTNFYMINVRRQIRGDEYGSKSANAEESCRHLLNLMAQDNIQKTETLEMIYDELTGYIYDEDAPCENNIKDMTDVMCHAIASDVNTVETLSSAYNSIFQAIDCLYSKVPLEKQHCNETVKMILSCAQNENGNHLDMYSVGGSLDSQITDFGILNKQGIKDLYEYAKITNDDMYQEDILKKYPDIVNEKEKTMMTEEQFMDAFKNSLTASPKVAAQFVRNAHKHGDLKTYLPEVDHLFDVPERADFHPEGNAGEHTLLAVSALKEKATSQQILAMVLHDVGKGVTYDHYMETLETSGAPFEQKKVAIGHAEKGVPLVENIAQRMKLSQEDTDFVKTVCAQHMSAHQWKEMKPKNMFKLHQNIAPEQSDAFVECCLADSLGRKISDEQKTDVKKEFNKGLENFLTTRSYMQEHPNEDIAQLSNDFARDRKAKEKSKDTTDYTNNMMQNKFNSGR